MIYDIANSDNFTMSFEVFPPRSEDLESGNSRYFSVRDRCREIIDMNPAWVSVTHRAGNSFEETLGICDYALGKGIPTVAHMRARDITFDEAREWGKICRDNGIAVLPVTGDAYKAPIKNIDGVVISYTSTDKGCFQNSSELTQFLSNIDGLELLGTWYDEPDWESAHETLCCKKAYYGAKLFVSQMIFNPEYITPKSLFKDSSVLTVPGILPILSTESYITQSKQVTIPKDFYKFASKASVDNGEAGMMYSAYEIRKIRDRGVPHVHLFTMDNIEATKFIQKEVFDNE